MISIKPNTVIQGENCDKLLIEARGIENCVISAVDEHGRADVLLDAEGFKQLSDTLNEARGLTSHDMRLIHKLTRSQMRERRLRITLEYIGEVVSDPDITKMVREAVAEMER